ncbi:YIP1 family protein [Catenovulum maritimum]|uniref:Yip1 domain-containing protein n=1 Tax=Catenovulum maritimum TaxID=1513271 RepID=A0A0J8H0E5_9ALTE|nr:YIP1 family protein [Catenovulum maritimum]KMT66488.1 hypothetical protein XM47_02805 [Catenovulum maritimum]
MSYLIPIFKNLVLRPKFAFQQISEHKVSSKFPFVFIFLSMLLFWFTYLEQVDLTWLIEHTINTQLSNMSAAEQAQLRQQMTPESIRYTYTITSALMTILQAVILAGYLNIVTKLDEENTDGFSDWFGFIWWVQFPLIIQFSLTSLIVLFYPSNQIDLTLLQFSSINQLVGLVPGDKLYTLLTSFDFFSLWSLVILFYGLSVKTSLSTKSLVNICLFPILMLILLGLFL